MPIIKSVKLTRGRTSKIIGDNLTILSAFLKQIAPYTKVLPVVIPANAIQQGRRLVFAGRARDQNA